METTYTVPRRTRYSSSIVGSISSTTKFSMTVSPALEHFKVHEKIGVMRMLETADGSLKGVIFDLYLCCI
ncbi:MAG: hypothetical protein ACREOZ_03975 [Gloeomargaritales cyanobacterium]